MTENIAEGITDLATAVEKLELDPKNARIGNVEAVVKSYERFGQRKPIVARRTGGTRKYPTGIVIAGNHQLQAAKQLGWKKIAVVWTDDDEQTARAFALADNRTSDLAEYDQLVLAELLQELAADEDLLKATSYDPEDVERILIESTALARQQTAFLDPDADGSAEWVGSEETPDNPYFTVTVVCNAEQRELIRRALKTAQDATGETTTTGAMMHIANHYLATTPAEGTA